MTRAKELAQKAVELEQRAYNYSILTSAYMANGDRENALQAAKRAFELLPDVEEYRGMYEYLKGGN